MNITIKRTHHLPEVTLGQLFIEGVQHDPIFTLENPERETAADNRIPAGDYKCKPYSGAKYKDVYIVENVPGRSAILLHWGNTEKDTLGCILLGNKLADINHDHVLDISESRACFDRFRQLVGKQGFNLKIQD